MRGEEKLTEETPFPAVEIRDIRIRMHNRRPFRIPRELRIKRSQRSDEPIVVLEETVWCRRLGAGEVPSEEVEISG